MNGKPKATVRYEGPIASDNPEMLDYADPHSTNNPQDQTNSIIKQSSLGRKLYQSILKHWPKIKDSDKLQRNPEERIGVLNHQYKVDWSNAGETEDAIAARAEVQKKNHESFKQYHANENAKALPVHVVSMGAIEAFQQTLDVKAKGWYRLCVQSDYTPLYVEMDMRSANALRGVDPETGHVFTHEKRQMMDDEHMLELDTSTLEGGLDSNTYASAIEERAKLLENQIREKDLEESKARLKYLHELTSEMMAKQHDHMNRIRSNSASAERSNAEMMRSSSVETALFAVITGFQVWTVRRWLTGQTLLGK